MKSLGNWLQLNPHRTFYLVRLGLYVVFTLIAGATLDPDVLLEIVGGVLGVAVADGIGTRVARSQTVPVGVNNELMRVSAAGQTGAYVAQYVTAILPTLLPGATLAKVLSTVVPGLETVLSSALTPEVERRVVDHVHQALRGANLMRRVDL